MSEVITITKDRTWWASYQREVLFLDGGRIWPRVDCYGFLKVALAAERSITLAEWPGLQLEALAEEGRELFEGCFTSGFKPLQIGLEQAFDCALIRRPMRVKGQMKRGWWHCGIVTRPGFIVHLDPGIGIIETCFRDCAESLGDPSMRARDVILYRHETLAAAAAAREQAA